MDQSTKRAIDDNRALLDVLESESKEDQPSADAKLATECSDLYKDWKPQLNEIQLVAYLDDDAKYMLLDGERGSGKTIGALHKMVRHCFENDSALGIIIVEVTSMAEEGGAWYKLNQEVLPVWAQGIKLFYTEPRLHPTSRKPFIWILNRHGTYSRIICLSMPVDTNVEDRVKGMEPSFVVVDEAQTLKSPKYFTAIVQQIGRRQKIEGPQQIVYCCNPDGPSHWLYKRFFEIPIDKETGEWNDDYARYHIPISENVLNLPPGYYDRVIEAVRGDPVEYARMVRGEWIDRPTGTAIFAEVWSEPIHVKGDAASNTGIVPVPGVPILVGYDLGPAHSSIHFLQCIPLQNGSVWIVFDEINLVDQFTPYHKIVPKVLGRMEYWDGVASGQKKKFVYDHIADSSAFNQLRSDGSYDVFVFQKVSAELGRPLVLRPAPKGPGSVAERVRMTLDMLRQGELLVSATCVKTREMFRMLESKPPGREYEPDSGLKPRRSPHLHVFDSMTYPIIAMRTGFRTYGIEENDARISFFG